MPLITLKIKTKIPNFDHLKELKNIHVLSNLLFHSNSKDEITKCITKVVKNIERFCDRKNVKPVYEVFLKRKVSDLRKKYREIIKDDKKTTHSATLKKQAFRTKLAQKFADGNYFKPNSVENETLNQETKSQDSGKNQSDNYKVMEWISEDEDFFETGSDEDEDYKEEETIQKPPEPEPKPKPTTKQLNGIVRYNVSLSGAKELLNVPRSTLHRKVLKNLDDNSLEAKNSIDKTARYVLHFDGKGFFDSETGKFMERNCYVLSKTNEAYELTIGVPLLNNKKAKTIAITGTELCKEWEVIEAIKGLGMDTTSTNTGRFNGVCVELERMFNKKLIFFACRHHIAELVLGVIVNSYEGKSTGPEIQVC